MTGGPPYDHVLRGNIRASALSGHDQRRFFDEMGKLGFLLHGVLVATVGAVLVAGSEGEAAQLVRSSDSLALLEADVAQAPTSESLVRLVAGYLERNQPGLAQAALDKHANLDDARLTHERSRVALAQGDVEGSLRLAQLTLATCDARPPVSPCAAWLVMKAVRQVTLLEAMRSAGVQDPAEDPALARIALASTGADVRLAH